MSNKDINILLVEDDENLGVVLKDFLEMDKYKVSLSRDGEAALVAFHNNTFDLLILDIMLPKLDGFSVAEEIRKKNKEVPIIFLTAKIMKEDRIRGFLVGGDDYITKPFSTEELNLRIQALLKRVYKTTTKADKNGIFEIGEYRFDYNNLALSKENNTQTLTPREAEILKLLCHNKNQILTRELMLKSVWGEDDYFMGRSMDVFIARLRKYLMDDPNVTIANIHGTGFRLEIS